MGYIGTPTSYANRDYQIVLMVNSGASVTASNGITTKVFKEENEVVLIKGLRAGNWTLNVTKNNHIIYRDFIIEEDMECVVYPMYFNMVPDFECTTGDIEIIDDGNNKKSIGDITNWRIKVNSSCTLKFHDLKHQYIDVFLVGGGGNAIMEGAIANGGGGGYTKTVKNNNVSEGKTITINIGSTGSAASDSSRDTSFICYDQNSEKLEFLAEHGGDAYSKSGYIYGGNGGSGGGGGGADNYDYVSETIYPMSSDCGNGGSDGENGENGPGQRIITNGPDGYIDTIITAVGGTGQGMTTREFEELSSDCYSPGGAGGCGYRDGKMGAGLSGANSGAGGTYISGGHSIYGESGIVIIRNSRGQYGFKDFE